MSATDEAAGPAAAAAATSEEQQPLTAAESKPAVEAEAAASSSAADAKQKEKEEKERVKKEKEEQKKREAEEKKREAEEKKRKREEEKKAKDEAKAKAKAEAKATENKPAGRCSDVAIDITNRDRNQINCHINVQFEDIIAEPDPTVFSFDNVWTVSYKVFTSTKLWCYRITSLICAVPAAICWGIEFAMLSFCTIWCWQPSLKAMDISLWYTRRIYEILLKVFVEPCFHAAGKCLSHIVVHVRHDA